MFQNSNQITPNSRIAECQNVRMANLLILTISFNFQYIIFSCLCFQTCKIMISMMNSSLMREVILAEIIYMGNLEKSMACSMFICLYCYLFVFIEFPFDIIICNCNAVYCKLQYSLLLSTYIVVDQSILQTWNTHLEHTIFNFWINGKIETLKNVWRDVWVFLSPFFIPFVFGTHKSVLYFLNILILRLLFK